MEKVKITNSTVLFATLLIVGLLLSYYARYVLLASVIGIGFGVLITPIPRYLRGKFHLPRGVSVVLLFILFSLVLIGVTWALYYLLADQFSSLTERFPSIVEDIKNWTSSMFERYPWLRDKVQQVNAGDYVRKSFAGVFKGFRTGLIALSGFIFIIVLGLYTALNGKEYFNSLVEAFRPKDRDKARNVLSECASVLRGWFNAQLIDMGIIGVITAVGLWIAGVEYWAIFGLLTAVLGIIPYVGIILVVIITGLITLSSDPSKVPWVLGIYFVTQQLEGNLILPLVMKGKVQLPVVPLLIFMTFLTQFFGLIGVFIAPPLLAVLRTLYIELYLPKINENA